MTRPAANRRNRAAREIAQNGGRVVISTASGKPVQTADCPICHAAPNAYCTERHLPRIKFELADRERSIRRLHNQIDRYEKADKERTEK